MQEFKTSLKSVNSGLDHAEERVSNFEDKASNLVEATQKDTRITIRNENNIQETLNTIKQPNSCIYRYHSQVGIIFGIIAKLLKIRHKDNNLERAREVPHYLERLFYYSNIVSLT